MTHERAALSAVRRTGRAAEIATVVHARSSVLVRVDPGPIAVRLPGATAAFRDPVAAAAREGGLAAALAGLGAPVPAPIAVLDDGIMLWPWLELGRPGDGAVAGRALRACHDALAELALDREPLWLLHEARALAQGDVVRAAVDRALAGLAGADLRPVHGDSHAGNVLWTAGGPLWGDWEDAMLAPLEWDLACLVIDRDVDFGWSDAALEAHGGAYDSALLEACVHARRAQAAAYMQHLLPFRPDLRAPLAAAIARL
ncbi:MAG: phosphotransferase family protein [Solirubrobacteraceae bacterium]